MQIRHLAAATAALLVIAGGAVTAEAQSKAEPAKTAKAPRKPAVKPAKAGGTITGIDSIHAQRKVGGKTCFVDHDHAGEGEMASRKGAEAAAIRKWQIFTADEYGTAWGRYELAIAKSMTCTETGGRWRCNLSAIPCRPG